MTHLTMDEWRGSLLCRASALVSYPGRLTMSQTV